jgi:uncharacterized protein YdaU (DUF1376 family)
MKPPAFQLYADDLISGTLKFSDAELGLYMRLLCAQWNEGSLPDDDEELLSYGRGRTPLNRVKAKFNTCADGRLRNARMERVRKEQEEYRENRRESGKLGAEKRWHSHSTAIAQPLATPSLCHSTANGKRIASGMANVSSPSPTPSPITNKTTKLPAKRFSPDQAELVRRIEICLGIEWENDRSKWMKNIDKNESKSERVIAEVENALKEGSIKTTPAKYAEHIWGKFA